MKRSDTPSQQGKELCVTLAEEGGLFFNMLHSEKERQSTTIWILIHNWAIKLLAEIVIQIIKTTEKIQGFINWYYAVTLFFAFIYFYVIF